ncbi:MULTISPECIES: hypothetical protein [Burkholderia]|uniref:hypothetical protein n=1 Tax=Burkholderia TaxID=32008 RepID=UPI0016408252|nr:hypothetical protein [Burkholderia gladioli]
MDNLRKTDFLHDEEKHLAERLSTHILDVYNNLLGNNFDNDSALTFRGIATEEEVSFIRNIPLRFNAQYGDYLAYATFSENAITYNLHAEVDSRIEKVLIHELAHLIACKFGINSRHTLDFAILTYCIQDKLTSRNEQFFRAYDIHEDEAYPYLSINPFLFDKLIKQIEFKSIKELCVKSRNLAKLIRKQSLSIPLSKINGEIEI